jgi:aminoglycoside 3-N-acetyltransferase I
MNAPFAVRRLAAGDIDAARRLNSLFAEVFEDPQNYLAAPSDENYLARLLEKDSLIALVAEAEGAVVGGLVGYDLPKLEQARSEIYIYDLAVAADRRREGIATALIAEVQQIATATGAWVIYVQADHVDAPAVALYTKLGTREDVLHFDILPQLRK